MVPAQDDPKEDGERVTAAPSEALEDVDDERVDTPFDHPLFLPVVLLGLSLWFLWDGFIVPLEDHLVFNRGGFALFALGTLWYGYKGFQEMRAIREERDERGSEPDS